MVGVCRQEREVRFMRKESKLLKKALKKILQTYMIRKREGFSLYSGTSLPLRASNMGNFGCVAISTHLFADFLTEDKGGDNQTFCI